LRPEGRRLPRRHPGSGPKSFPAGTGSSENALADDGPNDPRHELRRSARRARRQAGQGIDQVEHVLVFEPLEEPDQAKERIVADLAEESSNVYEHQWAVGDLVIWDNWASIHARKDFPRDQQRLMRRLVIMGQPLSA